MSRLRFEYAVFRGGMIHVNTHNSNNAQSSIIVEIRAAEGGKDAKNLVLEQRSIYLRLCARRGL